MLSLLAASEPLLIGCVALLGLMVGSFLNVVVYRLPVMLERRWQAEARELLALAPADESTPSAEPFNLATPRSRCGSCGTTIPARHNLPVLSWLLLRGRAACCGARISARYPLVELLTALASAACAWRFGFTPELAAALLLSWTLVALTFIDLDTQLLPDDLTLPLVWLGLLLALAGVRVGEASLADAVIGAVAGYLALWSVYWGFRLATGKEGMGYGDFKLLAALGAWLGWQALPQIILLSSLVGAVSGLALIALRRQERSAPMPFGPYLAVAGWLALMGVDLLAALD